MRGFEEVGPKLLDDLVFLLAQLNIHLNLNINLILPKTVAMDELF